MRTPPTNGRVEPGGRRESTERRILESALELLAAGVTWHQLGIRQIADRAAISRTAFYDFFGSKNEILEHLVRRLHDDLGTLLLQSTAWRADDARSPVLDLLRLRALLHTLDAFAQSNGMIYRAFLDAAREDPEIDALWDDLIGVYVALVARSIDEIRAHRTDVPTAPSSRTLAWSLVLMTERTVLLLGREALGERAMHLDALTLIWERSVFGMAPGHPSDAR